MPPFGKIAKFFTSTPLFLALNSVLVIHFSTILYEVERPPVILLLSFLATIAVYSLNKATDQTEDLINNPVLSKFRLHFIISASICYLITLAVGIIYGTQIFLVLLTPLSIGFVYSVKISKSLPRFKEVLGVKNCVVAFNWAFAGSLLPAVMGAVEVKMVVLVFLHIFIQLFINTVLFDILDICGDYAANVKTIPLRIGKEKTACFLVIVNSLLFIWIGFCFIAGLFIKYLPIAVFEVFYNHVIIWYFTTHKTKRFLVEIFVDGIWMPIVVILWLIIH